MVYMESKHEPLLGQNCWEFKKAQVEDIGPSSICLAKIKGGAIYLIIGMYDFQYILSLGQVLFVS
jgi:hypothetical protein